MKRVKLEPPPGFGGSVTDHVQNKQIQHVSLEPPPGFGGSVTDHVQNNLIQHVSLEPPPGFGGSSKHHVQDSITQQLHIPKSPCPTRECEEEGSSLAPSLADSGGSLILQGQSPSDDTGPSATSSLSPPPTSRQFWKAGIETDGAKPNASFPSADNYLHVHPLFLHSNATSHKWPFGAVAELLDNAVDEVQNGASFVSIDKTINPRDGSAALLIQDDGGGMDPDAMRRCMSFGFSDKKVKTAIGQYGNGFKTGTMRLGGDVIVFSRHLKDSVMSQSIGLLSYTFLMRMGYDRIVVPMVDYELNAATGTMEASRRYGKDHFDSNLSMLVQWSPYSSEADLVQQCEDIGSHGTKVIIYNLWLNSSGNMELDFDSNPEDICIHGDKKKVATLPAWKPANEQHVAYRLQYSLREYLSILYLRMPKNFSIMLRGQPIEHRNIANDLKYIEYILYRPQSGGFVEGQVVTTIGFLKESPLVNVHGFSLYHKNRLILPFWPVINQPNRRGRGVVGVLEANFIEPIHNKQDFERTSLFQKLEVRLKEMAWEYWETYCGLIGYYPTRKTRVLSCDSLPNPSKGPPTVSKYRPAAVSGVTETPYGPLINRQKRKRGHRKRRLFEATETTEMAGGLVTREVQHIEVSGDKSGEQETADLMQERDRLRELCSEYEKSEKELNETLSRLTIELEEAEVEYGRLLVEASSLN